jgi:hypothetical protein
MLVEVLTLEVSHVFPMKTQHERPMLEKDNPDTTMKKNRT